MVDDTAILPPDQLELPDVLLPKNVPCAVLDPTEFVKFNYEIHKLGKNARKPP